MNDPIQPFDHVCGEVEAVDVSRFLDYCAAADFAEVVPDNMRSIRADYAHLNRCGPCMTSLQTVFSEHRRVNPRFAAQTVLRNMKYLSAFRE